MTIALGILAGNSIVLASDTEHSYDGGEIKGNDAKILASSMIVDGIQAVSAGIIGAGYTNYVNAIRSDILQYLCQIGQSSSLRVGPLEIKAEIERQIKIFYDQHVMPFYPFDKSVEFDLMIGAKIRGLRMLLCSGKTSIRPVIGSECIGAGSSYGTMILNNLRLTSDVPTAVLQACYTVKLVKDTINGCGKSTQILCLNETGTHYITEDILQEMEAIVLYYSKWKSDALSKLFDGDSVNTSGLRGMKRTLSRLRTSISQEIQ